MENNSTDIEREKAVLEKSSKIDHPNIMKLHYWAVENGEIFLFLELCDMTFKEFLRQREILAENEALFYFEQIINGLDCLHSQGMMHRDLKPDNIFMQGDKIVLGDFGLSIESNMAASIVGTPLYMDNILLGKQ